MELFPVVSSELTELRVSVLDMALFKPRPPLASTVDSRVAVLDKGVFDGLLELASVPPLDVLHESDEQTAGMHGH